MTFNIVAMICIAGMSPADCGPEPGFSRDKVIIGKVSNEIDALDSPSRCWEESAPSKTSRKASSSRSCASGTADRCSWTSAASRLPWPERPKPLSPPQNGGPPPALPALPPNTGPTDDH